MGRPWIRGFVLSPILAFFFAANLYAQNNFVYTNDDVFGPNTVSGFAVTGNGALTPLSRSPFLIGGTGGGWGLFASNRGPICSAEQLLSASKGVIQGFMCFF